MLTHDHADISSLFRHDNRRPFLPGGRGARVWNALPSFVTDSSTMSAFKRHLKTYLYARSLSWLPSHCCVRVALFSPCSVFSKLFAVRHSIDIRVMMMMMMTMMISRPNLIAGDFRIPINIDSGGVRCRYSDCSVDAYPRQQVWWCATPGRRRWWTCTSRHRRRCAEAAAAGPGCHTLARGRPRSVAARGHPCATSATERAPRSPRRTCRPCRLPVGSGTSETLHRAPAELHATHTHFNCCCDFLAREYKVDSCMRGNRNYTLMEMNGDPTPTV